MQPDEIEKKSFSIIEEELGAKGIIIPEEQRFIIHRVIHTTADFEYARTMTFSEGVLKKAGELLKKGAVIVTDTNMALSGIHKKTMEALGCKAFCFMADEDVAKEAKARGITRAAVSMEKAMSIREPVIFAIGNAPTALLTLHEKMEEGYRPGLIIGVPVGFVNVEQSKELILHDPVPFIVNRGRKGGSSVAAAIVNALLYEADPSRGNTKKDPEASRKTDRE